jgi:putative ABC transport system permease protein
MNWTLFLGSIELGLIYSLVSLGVYLSFRTLQFPDLTVDGSFPLGAAICAALIINGVHPLLATVIATMGGCFFGLITAILSTHLKVLNLLAGILNMSALYSINLRIMSGKPNLSLLGHSTLFTWIDGIGTFISSHGSVRLMILGGIVVSLALALTYLLTTQAGLAMRACGNNDRLARSVGVSDFGAIKMGLALSNGLVALSGALFTQTFGFADVSMGIGTIINGLASVIIGEAVLSTRTVKQAVLACILGSILYRMIIALALNLGDIGLEASDLNIVTAAIVTIAIVTKKKWIKA